MTCSTSRCSIVPLANTFALQSTQRPATQLSLAYNHVVRWLHLPVVCNSMEGELVQMNRKQPFCLFMYSNLDQLSSQIVPTLLPCVCNTSCVIEQLQYKQHVRPQHNNHRAVGGKSFKWDAGKWGYLTDKETVFTCFV